MNPNGELHRAVVFGGLLCLLTLALPNSLRSALAVCFVLALPLFAWIALRVPRDEAQVLFALVAAAVGVRLIVATVIATLAPENFFSLDQRRYEWLGEAMALAWAGEGSLPENIHAKPGYYVWNALVYSAVGFVPLAVTFSNAAIAGGSVLLVYRIARDLADVRAARIAAGLAAFFPSLVLWSSLNLKDAAAILTLLLVVRGAQRLQQRPCAGALVQLCVGVALLSQLRDYLVWIVLAGAAVGLVLPRLRSVPALLLVAATLAGVALTGAAGLQSEQMPSLRFDLLEQHRRNLAVGGSAYHGDADVSSPLAALRFLPVGLGYFLFAPAPWQLWNARQWMTLPEMLAWYALLPQLCFGLRSLWQRRQAACLPLLAIAALITVAYALVEANLGTAYRHRAQVLVLYLTIAAIGLAPGAHRIPRRDVWDRGAGVRVLVVAYYFPPLGGGGVHRTLQWVRHLAERGDEPWVLTVDDAAWAHDPEGLHRVPDVARVVRIPNPDWGRVAAWRDRRRSGGPGSSVPTGPGRLRRWLVPDLAVGWSALAIPAALALARAARFDAVYTTAPPYSAHGVGWALSQRGLPWLADFRDGWLDCPTRVDFGPARRRLESRLESAVFARAGGVVFAGAAARERAVRRCPGLAARSTTVLTGFAPEDPAPTPAPSGPTLQLVHAGSMGVNQMASSFGRFLDALRAWRARRPTARFALRLLGAEASLTGAIAARGLADWVTIAPAVPREALGRELAAAHAALVLSAKAPFGTDPIPGKCFDAIAAGRPLLAWTPTGGLADWIASSGTGVVVDPAQPAALGRQLDRWLDALGEGGLSTLSAGERAAFAAPEAMERIRERVVALVAAEGRGKCASA